MMRRNQVTANENENEFGVFEKNQSGLGPTCEERSNGIRNERAGPDYTRPYK